MKRLLIGLLLLGLLMSLLGTDIKTADGTVTIPTGCVYVVAVSVGTINPPYLNGNLMQTKGSVAATGQVGAISAHVSTFPIQQELPFVLNGASRVVWFFLDDAVCTRPVPVSGYSAAGQVTGTLNTSTDDIVVCVVLGSNGQVLLKGDTVGATLIYDSTTCRIGYLVPGDSSLSCDASDQTVASGYWYYPPAYYTDTSSSVLVTAGYYRQTAILHERWMAYAYKSGSNYYYQDFGNDGGGAYSFGPPYLTGGTYLGQITSYHSWYTYIQTWVPPVYETQPSGYWTYPPPQWIATGIPGEISCIYISVADTMIGSVYVTRPLCC